YSQLKTFIARFKAEENVAAIQADLVPHGMGAPVVRAMALQSQFLDDPTFPTFGEGPIRRVILLAGAHRATPLANLLWQCAKAQTTVGVLGTPADQGAIEDLAYGSASITAINAQSTPFPVHTIVGGADADDMQANAWLATLFESLCDRQLFTLFSHV